MNPISNFLHQKNSEVQDIINELNNVFSSHEFINELAHRYEEEYINFLIHYKGQDAFRKVNSLIARFLSDNATTFKIKKQKRAKSTNVFGKLDYIQFWEKI